MADLVGDGNGVSANEEFPRGSGDEGTDASGFGGMMPPYSWRTQEIEVEHDRLR